MANYVEFEAIREPWNIYELKDGTILKARFILIKVMMEGVDEAKNPLYSFNAETVLGSFPPTNLVGEPSLRNYTLEERVDAIEEELSPIPLKEEASEYKLKDGTSITVKLVVTKVARTKLRDPKGEPLYLVNSQPVMTASVPKELREKLKKQ